MSSKYLFHLSNFFNEVKSLISTSAIYHGRHNSVGKVAGGIFTQQSRNVSVSCRPARLTPFKRLLRPIRTINNATTNQFSVFRINEAIVFGNICRRFLCTSQTDHHNQQVSNVTAKSGGSQTDYEQISNVTVRSGGKTFDVVYRDIGDRDGPVVLCIHGAPASHRDFTYITPSLLDAGVRLITPNFPGYGYSDIIEGDSFSFSVEEKSQYIQDFLLTIGINRVAVLVAHSAAGATASQLCADANFMDSVVFISGMNLRSHRTAKPQWLFALASKLILNPISGAIVKRVIPPLRVFFGNIKVGNPAVILNVVHEVAEVSWPKSKYNVELLRKSGLPVMVIGSESDRIVEVAIAKEKMDLLGIDHHYDVLYFNEDGVPVSGDIEDHKAKPRRGVIFEKGGHYLQKSHPDEIAMLILDMLRLVEK